MDRWSEADARIWWQSRPWVCGVNFLPSSAVNFIEMWHPDGFDMDGIERELGWASEIGFNAIRINLPFVGWQADRDGLMDRFDRVMGTAAAAGIDVVPCLFDDCGFGGAEPVWGPQPDPLPGVHNSRAVASPGRASVLEPAQRPDLERYVRDVIATFRDDPRVLFWDLYNEPGNRMTFSAEGTSEFSRDLEAASLSLMEHCFAWAREIGPGAPLTVAAWTTPMPGDDGPPYQADFDRAALRLSDIVTFHAYWGRDKVAGFIDYLEELDRPMFCTEWMARPIGSRIDDQLALFRNRGVGCFQWGFVKGRSQTWLPWPDDLVQAHGVEADRSVWFHDLLHEDGTPYDAAEVEIIRNLTRDRAGGREEETA